MNSPLVTIAIPAYKKAFLKEAVKSALNQTYSNIELIIVDDNSPEKISDLIQEFSDSRIKFYKNEENQGLSDPSKNWNICLNHANGEFFSLLCDDDVYAPTFIEEMLNLQNQFPNYTVFRSRVKTIDTKGQVINWYPSAPTYETGLDYMYQKMSGFRRQTISEFFYNTKYIKKLGGFTNMPRAWTSDSLSIYKFSWEKGIISSQKCLCFFRESTQNISSVFSDALDKGNAIFLYKEEINSYINSVSNIEQKKLLQDALYISLFHEITNLCSMSSFFSIFRIILKGQFPLKWIPFILFKKLSNTLQTISIFPF